eukprot:8184406-Alexandrium_andersonii.AAC.1
MSVAPCNSLLLPERLCLGDAQVLISHSLDSLTYCRGVVAALPKSMAAVAKAHVCAYAMPATPAWQDYPVLVSARDEP